MTEATEKMAEYPTIRHITWVDEVTGDTVGRAKYIHVESPELTSVMQWLDSAIVLIESELRPMNSARDALDKLEEIMK